MKYTKEDVLQYVESEDVKFIRLAFCDEKGRQKNVAIMPGSLREAFLRGEKIDPSGIEGFSDLDELLLRPDPQTLVQMPWRPQHGRVVHLFCDLFLADGTPAPGDQRRILRELAGNADISVDTELEFALYKLNDNGEPTPEPLDYGGYLDVAPKDKGENVRRAICLTLEQMGIAPLCSYHAASPGKYVVRYAPADPVAAADNLVLFRDLVRTIAAQNGLSADFSDSRFAVTVQKGSSPAKTVRLRGGEQNPYTLFSVLLQTA